MAIAGSQYTVSVSPMATCRVALPRGEPGDLAMISVRWPRDVASGPAGWHRHGAAFWKVMGAGDDLEPMFTAATLGPWEFEVAVACAGTYELGPAAQGGTSAPWVAA